MAEKPRGEILSTEDGKEPEDELPPEEEKAPEKDSGGEGERKAPFQVPEGWELYKGKWQCWLSGCLDLIAMPILIRGSVLHTGTTKPESFRCRIRGLPEVGEASWGYKAREVSSGEFLEIYSWPKHRTYESVGAASFCPRCLVKDSSQVFCYPKYAEKLADLVKMGEQRAIDNPDAMDLWMSQFNKKEDDNG